ncbi:uncharacterized protein LOC127395177 [Apus apus]|uniref:uncharacterized protein LOC127395177 n=1 Tax=Apus apus TaxID=8895 RepID=UPI0021F8CB42|nr:uncharacterized protein LOC127395177 [Apus apus]
MSNNSAECSDGLKTEQTLAAMNLLDLFPNLQLYMWYVAEGILLFVAALVILLWFIDRTVAIINRIITSLVILGMMILFSMGSLYVYGYTASPTGTTPKVNRTVHVGNSNSWFNFTSPYSLKLNLPALDVNSMVAVGMFLLNVYNILWMRRTRCCSAHCHSPTGNVAATAAANTTAANTTTPAATKTTASTKKKPDPSRTKLVNPVTRSKAKTKAAESEGEEEEDPNTVDGAGTSQTDKKPSHSQTDKKPSHSQANKRTAGPPQSDDDDDLAHPFSVKELRLMRKDFTRIDGEGILPWLLRCFDSGAETYNVDEREAKQLGSLARDAGIDRALSSKTGTTTLWDRLLSAVRERYPHKGDIGWRRSRTPTLEKAITYLREIAVREVIYNNDGITDPDDVECDTQMFRKFVQAVPAAHAHIFSFMGCFEGYERPTVREVTVKARQYGDILSDSLYFQTSAVKKMVDRKYKMPKGSKLQTLPRDDWSRVAAIKKRHPATRQQQGRQDSLRRHLWSLLKNHFREDMRVWDKKPTDMLQLRVQELLNRTKPGDGSSKRKVAPVNNQDGSSSSSAQP